MHTRWNGGSCLLRPIRAWLSQEYMLLVSTSSMRIGRYCLEAQQNLLYV